MLPGLDAVAVLVAAVALPVAAATLSEIDGTLGNYGFACG